LRTQIIYQLSHKYGSHWHNNIGLFKDAKVFEDIQKHIHVQLTTQQKTEFIRHYMTKYNDPPTPPSWMSIELLFFNELSKICKNLNVRQDILGIAQAFGLPSDKIFCSWLHVLNYVRNICAHHARLWNIKFAIQPQKFENSKSGKVWLTHEEVNTVQSSKLYYFLCMVLYLLQTINPNSKFKHHFWGLLSDFPSVDVKYMGFPEEWREHPLWRI